MNENIIPSNLLYIFGPFVLCPFAFSLFLFFLGGNGKIENSIDIKTFYKILTLITYLFTSPNHI